MEFINNGYTIIRKRKGSKKEMKLYNEKIRIEDKSGNNIFNQLSYDELIQRITSRACRFNKFDVVAYLIGYNGVVTETDFENILKAYENNLID